MVDRNTRLRWRRRIRRSKRQVEDISFQAEAHLEKHFFKRLTKLPGILRFTITWLVLMVLIIGGLVVQTRALDNYYLINKPTPGGTYVEGVLGSYTNANPLFATGSVDKSVSQLIFSGLLRYDSNNKLTTDLASDWQVDSSGLNYTVHIPHNLKWQDGQPLTADDIIYTFDMIQDPDAQSPLQAGWQGVNMRAPDPYTVIFTLPNPLSTFPYSLTTGIIPKHILQKVPADQLRSISFNSTNPVGAGPFKFEALQVNGQTPETRQEQIALKPFDDYVNGKPKLNKFIIRAYHNSDSMVTDFRHQELNGMAGLDQMPKDLQNQPNVHEYDIPLQGEVVIFFKSTGPILSDAKVRQALTMATNRADIIDDLGYPVIPADEPILKSDLGYNGKYAELKFDQAAAVKLLASDGYQPNANGILAKKDGRELTFTLVTQDSPDYRYITKKLLEQWSKIGVKVNIDIQPDTQLQQTLGNHSYDALLYGIQMGPDPDVFAFWDSAQADVRAQNRTNFSEYSSDTADGSLEAGRTRQDPQLRAIKYQAFLQAWHNDAPAIVLYQPRYLYVTRGQIFGFNSSSLASDVARYANVDNWMISEDKQPR